MRKGRENRSLSKTPIKGKKTVTSKIIRARKRKEHLPILSSNPFIIIGSDGGEASLKPGQLDELAKTLLYLGGLELEKTV